MLRKLVIGIVASAGALVFAAAPASAHINEKIPANENRDARQGGTSGPGFIGPDRGFVGDTIYFRAHDGIQCGAIGSPNIDLLDFNCPSGR